MYNEVIKLRAYTEATDRFGVTQRTVTEKQIFAGVKSIGQSEFYQAQADGLKPELKFVIADYYDYSGEKEIEYDGRVYSVLRTYRTGKQLEIVVYGVDA